MPRKGLEDSQQPNIFDCWYELASELSAGRQYLLAGEVANRVSVHGSTLGSNVP